MNRLRAGGGGSSSAIPGIDADAAAWVLAVQGAGGTASGATLAAVSNFCISAKASGYWTKLNRINLFCGNQLAAALVPLKVGGGGATDTNVNFVAGDYTEATGLTGNGSTKYLRTGLVPSVSLTLNDTHLAIYNRAASAVGGNRHISAIDTPGGNFLEFTAPASTGTATSREYDGSGGSLSAAITPPYGLLVATRTGAASHVIYDSGSSVGSNATTGGGLPAYELYVFAQNSVGVAGVFSAQPLAAYSIGSGLSGADVTAYNTHMQTFQTALSRNV